MVRGMGGTKVKKRPWKSRMERDIILHKDIAEAYTQGGKALGEIIIQRRKAGKNSKRKK